MRILKKIVLFIVLIVTFLPNQVGFALNYNEVEGYGADTVAGLGTLISSSQTFPNAVVDFRIVKPDKSVLDIRVNSGVDGVAKFSLYDYHTKQAGRYFVSAKLLEASEFGNENYFDVYPDELSLKDSVLSSNKTVVDADFKDTAYVSVILKDKYGNKISHHNVNIVSSRSDDDIVPVNGDNVTDVNGTVVFKVRSGVPGVSVLSAIDVNSGKVLDSRLKIAFLNGGNVSDVGGEFFSVANAEGAGSIDRFEFSGDFDSVKANESISFSVIAVDKDGVKVDNYTGTIHFYAEGDNSSNVVFPEDYTFKSTDLGEHTFSLGLKFIMDGQYHIFVSDIDDSTIKGDKVVVVGSGDSSSSVGDSGASSIFLDSPKEGSYSSNVLSVSGVCDPLKMVKIYFDNSEIGSVQAGADGQFSYDTPKLADGEHSLYATMLDNSGNVVASSDPVKVVIDTTAPKIDSIVLSPKGNVEPGATVHIKVYSESNLSTAAILFNSDVIQLTPSLEEDGVYVGDIIAPKEAGEYFISVVLADQLDNEGDYDKQASFTVVDTGAGSSDNDNGNGNGNMNNDGSQDDGNNEGNVDNNLPPSKVVGVVAYGSDHKVTLVWDASNDEDGIVSHYRIFYGTSPSNLNEIVDTFDASTSWYIPNLVNGTEYYFSVYAVDDKGALSVEGSKVISAIPFTLEVESTVVNTPNEPLNNGNDNVYLRDAALEGNVNDVVPNNIVDNGPELYLFLVLSFVFAGVGRFLWKL